MEVTGILAQVNALAAPPGDLMRKRRGARQWLAAKVVQLEGSMTRTAKKHAKIAQWEGSMTKKGARQWLAAKIAQWEGSMTKRVKKHANSVQLESQMQALEM